MAPAAPPPAPRTLAVCADDFGRSAAARRAIVHLARAGRLQMISCRVNAPGWAADAAALRALPAGIGVGLHFNLTDGAPLSPRLAARWPRLPSLPWLALRAHLGLLPRGPVRSEFHAQLRAFLDATGSFPAHVDGHDHVHALPGVRPLVLDAAEHMRPVPAVRNLAWLPGPGQALRRALLHWGGGRALGRELVLRELAHNPALFGVGDAADTDYRAQVQGWLAQVPAQGALLACRPSDEDVPEAGRRAARRAEASVREYDYLASAAFADDLAQAGVVLGPVWQLRPRRPPAEPA